MMLETLKFTWKFQPKIAPKAKRCHQCNCLPTCGSCPRQDPQSLFRWCSAREQNCWQRLLFPKSIAQDGTAGGTYQCELHQPPGFKNPLSREVRRSMQTWKTWTRSVLSVKSQQHQIQRNTETDQKMPCSNTSGWQLAPSQPSRILARACLPPSQRRTFHVDIKKMKLWATRPHKHKVTTHMHVYIYIHTMRAHSH